MSLQFSNPKLSIGVEDADPFTLEPEGKEVPAVVPVDGPFEVTSVSPENEQSEEEIMVLANLQEELAEIKEGYTYNQASLESLFKATASLEELVNLVVEKVDVDDGSLDANQLEYINDRINAIQGETPELAPVIPLPSLEAFAAFPRPSLESASDSLANALKMAWEAIKLSYRRLMEYLDRFYQWVLKLFNFNKAQEVKVKEAVATVQAVAHRPDFAAHVRKVMETEKFTMSTEHVRYLWVMSNNGMSKDVPSDVRRLSAAFGQTQDAVDKSTIEWGTVMLHELRDISNYILSKQVKTHAQIAEQVKSWEKRTNEAIAEKAARANRVLQLHKGDYIGNITLTGTIDTVAKLDDVATTNAVTVPILSPDDIKHWQDARNELFYSIRGRFELFERNKVNLDRVFSEVTRMIEKDMKGNYAGIRYVEKLKNQLERYMARFHKHQRSISAVINRTARIVGVIDNVIVRTSKIYEKAEIAAAKEANGPKAK